MIKSISCLGFRSFSTKQQLKLAVPNGSRGSGLTVIVGPNGGGKSTLVECFNKIRASEQGTSFSYGKRNLAAGAKVEIEIETDRNEISVLKTINGSSETTWEGIRPSIYYLPSRRYFDPFFTGASWTRDQYLHYTDQYQHRTTSLNSYAYRLRELNKGDHSRFDEVLGKILGYPLQWAIDQDDNGQFYVSITKQQGLLHNSDGLGEGILSLLFIVDALCGSNKDELLVIDEPELSLHPQLQFRLLNELLIKSQYSQVIISTHSPTMLSLESIINGGIVARVFESDNGSEICMIDEESRDIIKSISHDINNPHILGIDARSCFFAEDGLIITEGQEDVILYPKVLSCIGMSLNIPFFGFGAGGAEKIVKIAHLLKCLGFKRVGAIYDGDKTEEFSKFNQLFSHDGYKAWRIPADDVRDKDNQNHPYKEKKGLLDKSFSLKSEYQQETISIFKDIQSFLF